jgi:hypothetical protein
MSVRKFKSYKAFVKRLTELKVNKPGVVASLLLGKFINRQQVSIYSEEIIEVRKPGQNYYEWQKEMQSLGVLVSNRIVSGEGFSGNSAAFSLYTPGPVLQHYLDKENATKKDVDDLRKELDALKSRVSRIESNVREYIEKVDPPVTEEKVIKLVEMVKE